MKKRYNLIQIKEYPDAIWFVLFTLSIFVQIVLFHYLAFTEFYISPIITDPLRFWAFYLPKISISILIGALALLIKRKYWLVIISLLIDVWCWSELWYYRVNSIFLDKFSITIIDNMDGFWTSLYVLIRPMDFCLLAVTVVLIPFLFILKGDGRRFKSALVVLLVGIVLHICSAFLLRKEMQVKNVADAEIRFNPFSEDGAVGFWGFTSKDYICQTSVVHAFIYDAWGLMTLPFSSDTYEMTVQDIDAMQPYLNANMEDVKPQTKLVIILYESLETWAYTPKVMPNIYGFMQRHKEHTLLANRLTKQTMAGTSSDGQLIINTGMLPIKQGTLCYRYPRNRYPSLSELYNDATLVIPGDLGVWNQKRMSDAYHIKRNISIMPELDELVMDSLIETYQVCPYVLAVTIGSHAPFRAYAGKAPMVLPDDMPEVMCDYLNSVHYTDSCIGLFLKELEHNVLLDSTTVVITGDHTIFDDDMRRLFSNWDNDGEEKYDAWEAYCPLIVYSPAITEKIELNEVAYQMDVYPTVLHIIGCENTRWKGFGANLLDEESRANRVDVKFVEELSDKVIRANFFETW